MRVAFHPAAAEELEHAAMHYESLEPGLGQDFALEIHSAVQRAVEYPHAWPRLDETVRRTLARRFPYGVLYVHDADELLVLAVMHLHRQPGYWKERR
ncbi:type II toxin-antitoxin system RelE/ParE family toxin [Guyparkeria halophila]|uniref:Type II toxin-antitoxin system RelE/ParE family toxin n=1 Tax=Guyparkeria halophila TaxID=47960 RepID=A0ABZ0YYR7_9GAMM|nr:type II toxin-antitoxin system RelE/ParE family toxin [Guyparkeria halophila]WQH16519.1 type II toxin-antitoxin system RelE/ParE family toxin [Guyparkeria halophila]